MLYPYSVWRAARMRALDERRDFRSVVIAALRAYLKLPKTDQEEE